MLSLKLFNVSNMSTFITLKRVVSECWAISILSKEHYQYKSDFHSQPPKEQYLMSLFLIKKQY